MHTRAAGSKLKMLFKAVATTALQLEGSSALCTLSGAVANRFEVVELV